MARLKQEGKKKKEKRGGEERRRMEEKKKERDPSPTSKPVIGLFFFTFLGKKMFTIIVPLYC